jgi:hypothetical protein
MKCGRLYRLNFPAGENSRPNDFRLQGRMIDAPFHSSLTFVVSSFHFNRCSGEAGCTNRGC